MSNAKFLQSIANRVVETIPRDALKTVAADGFKGDLPEWLEADDAEELRTMVQDTALCISAGAMRP
jgi:hypothetical protein